MHVRILCLCSALKTGFSLVFSCQHPGRQRKGAREPSMEDAAEVAWALGGRIPWTLRSRIQKEAHTCGRCFWEWERDTEGRSTFLVYLLWLYKHIFLSNLFIQCEAQTPKPEIKSTMLYWLSHPGDRFCVPTKYKTFISASSTMLEGLCYYFSTIFFFQMKKLWRLWETK